jgi:hypothetical protein
MKNKEVEVFMDGVDWQYEIAEAAGGNKVYASVEDLKENQRCWDSCGIVKCKITLVEWVEEQNLFQNTRHYTNELEEAKNRLKWLQEQTSLQEKQIEKMKGNK